MKLPQENTVWEGDRRSLHDGLKLAQGEALEVEDYVLWVDGTQGMVRSMDTVPPETGPEAIVRTLLQAIEYPHQPGRPARPKKIVVRDRQIQLYLKSILQDLEINLEFVPVLPLIDELFESFQSFRSNRPPDLPPKYGDLLLEKAEQVWMTTPWNYFQDHQILAIEINQWDIDTVYVSILGNLGMEFGILAYRTLESLKEFRMRATSQGDMAEMEAAFLAQDCIFLNYDTDEVSVPFPGIRRFIPYEDVEPSFGSLHPLEGMRPFLHEEETIALVVILDAIDRFVQQNRSKIMGGEFPALQRSYKIPLPEIEGIPNPLTVKVSTMPELAAEFMQDEDEEGEDLFRDDLIPENAYLSFSLIDWDSLGEIRSQVKHHQSTKQKPKGEGLPVIMVQTSVAKAKKMIKELDAVGGLAGIGLNPASDGMGEEFQLGLFKAMDETLFLFGEFSEQDLHHATVLEKWRQRCKNSNGYCALIIAKGNSGKTKGRPAITDILAFYEVKSLSEKDFGLGVLGQTPVPFDLSGLL
jgi:hypothetical protein